MQKLARHVVMSFVSADDATVAVLLLHHADLASADVSSFTPGQMRARAAIVLGRACPPGLKPELVFTQRELARHGHSFVLVRVSTESLLRRVRRIAAEARAHTVQTSSGRATQSAPARSAVRAKTSSLPTGRWRAVAGSAAAP